MIKSTIAFLGLLLIAQPALAQKPTRDQKVRADKAEVEAKGFWLYNDLDKAYQLARQSGKPILVALRCIPCEECVKLDDDLVDNDPIIRPLLEQFVCVRIVGTNGLDLNTFQYDTDQSFALFMLNADKTIYGRFGTRSHRTDWMGDVSLDGMARALDGALALHKQYPDNRSLLAGKTGKPLEFDTPEKYPALSEKYTDRLNYSGDVVKSCIHCHQIGDARRDYYWEQSQPIPEPILFPYPHPKAVGMILDPNQRATVKDITAGTPAAASGLQPGDEIVLMNGQPLLSMADVQWILHHVPAEGGEIALRVRRDDEVIDTSLTLGSGWRQADDISWRVSSWGMRGIATGGLSLKTLADNEKQALGLEGAMALRITHVGQYNKHAAAKRAGFQVDDILISYDGRTDLRREADVFAYVGRNLKHGDVIDVEILRDGKRRQLTLPIQK
ncbi:MAG: PDZ domain-containing protein [Planctomycetales bacterium]|nr:PDZ domain-containing protein [Planctomycetales bacterium]